MAITFGPQFLINTATDLDQDTVRLAGLANGLFVAAYESKFAVTNGSIERVFLQVFNADGSKYSAEVDDIGITTVVDPVVVAAPDATFYVGKEALSSQNGASVGSSHLDIDGNPQPNANFGFFQSDNVEVAIAVRSDGGRFAVYQHSNLTPGADDPNIRGSFFIEGHNSTNTNDVIMTATTGGAQNNPDVAALDNGRFVTVWESGSNIAFRFSSVSFVPFGPDPAAANLTHLGTDTFVAPGSLPKVAAFPGGNFVVLWYNDGGGSPNRILGRLYDENGTSLGDFVAATNVDRNSGVDRDIAVTVLNRNEFAVGWTGLAGTSPNGTDTSGTYIDAAIFNAAAPVGTSAFTVAASLAALVPLAGGLTGITAGNQFDPSLTTLADGRMVLGWSDESGSADDASGRAARGRIIDARDNAVTTLGTAGHDDYIGTAFNDRLNGLGGADKLTGAAGNDKLDGGSGNDTLILGNGTDTVVYSTGYGADTVEDFVLAGAGEADKADLRGVANVHTLADVLARATQVGDDVVIDFDGGDTLTLKFVQKGNLNESNFLLAHLPVITSNGGGDNASVSMAENATAVTTVTATDPDVPTTLVFSISGGADAARFKIGTATGTLAFVAAPDFEAPADADANNSYVVQVRASDGSLTDDQTITVSVTDVDEQPGPNPSPTPSPGGALFDELFYLSHNPDVAAAGVDALFHYNTVGFHEGRDPNAFFDTSFYLAVNHDVLVSGVNPLEHFHTTGWKQGRDPGPDFDTTFYLLRNPDVAAAQIDPLEHFLVAGQFEGRTAFPAIGTAVNGFDAQFYILHNPDVAAAGVDPFFHYSVVGFQEGRNPNAYFDTAGYLSHYTDVAAAGINPLSHYEAVGWTEGRDPSAGFDTLGYLAANPDVAAAGMNPLDHFLQFGIYEGRTAINDGLFH
jgi:serralysin